MSGINEKRKEIWEDISKLPEDFVMLFTKSLQSLDTGDLRGFQKLIDKCFEEDLIELRTCNDMNGVKDILHEKIETATNEDAFSFLQKSISDKVGVISGKEYNIAYNITLDVKNMVKGERKNTSLYYFSLPYRIDLIYGDKSISFDDTYLGTAGVNKSKNISSVVSRIKGNVRDNVSIFVQQFVHPHHTFKGNFLWKNDYMKLLEFMRDVFPECNALKNNMDSLPIDTALQFFHFTPDQLDLMKQVSRMWLDYSYSIEEDGSYAVIFENGDFIVWSLVEGVFTQESTEQEGDSLPKELSPLFNRLALASRLSQ